MCIRDSDTGGYVPESSDLFETAIREQVGVAIAESDSIIFFCLLYTSPSPRDRTRSRMPSSA